jgi:hypothetical protein
LSARIPSVVERLRAGEMDLDRELEADVFRALGYEVARHARGWRRRGRDRDFGARWESLPRPLRSLEDALRLVDRHAPGAAVELSWSPGRARAAVRRVAGAIGQCDAPSPGRALVAALLLALGVGS